MTFKALSDTALDQAIRQLAQRPPTIDAAARRSTLLRLLNGMPRWVQRVPRVNEEANAPRKFFRARRGFHHRTDLLWAPPTANVRVAGRANPPNRSVLYCTDEDIFSCLLEVVERDEPARAKDMTVISFELRRDLHVVPVGVVDQARWEAHWRPLLPATDFARFIKISQFLDSEFRRNAGDGHDYMNSSVFSSLVLDDLANSVACGLRYKTIQNFPFAHSGLNYALLPGRVQDALEPISAARYRYRWNEAATYRWEVLEYSLGTIEFDGAISWSAWAVVK